MEIRPIYHYKDRRVKTHIFLCIIAQTIATKLRDGLKESGWLDEDRGNSFQRCIDEFHKIGIGKFQIEGKEMIIMSKIHKEQRRILKLIGLDEIAFSSFDNAKKACRLI